MESTKKIDWSVIGNCIDTWTKETAEGKQKTNFGVYVELVRDELFSAIVAFNAVCGNDFDLIITAKKR